jgi:hypothetical protein
MERHSTGVAGGPGDRGVASSGGESISMTDEPYIPLDLIVYPDGHTEDYAKSLR